MPLFSFSAPTITDEGNENAHNRMVLQGILTKSKTPLNFSAEIRRNGLYDQPWAVVAAEQYFADKGIFYGMDEFGHILSMFWTYPGVYKTREQMAMAMEDDAHAFFLPRYPFPSAVHFNQEAVSTEGPKIASMTYKMKDNTIFDVEYRRKKGQRGRNPSRFQPMPLENMFKPIDQILNKQTLSNFLAAGSMFNV